MNYRSISGKKVNHKFWLYILFFTFCTLVITAAHAYGNPYLQEESVSTQDASGHEIKLISKPTTGKLSFKLVADKPVEVKVLIFDIIGNKLMEEDFHTEPLQPEYEIQTGNLNSGIYIVQFSAGTTQKSYKVILQ